MHHYEHLKTEKIDKVLLVTLNRPPYNPLSSALYGEILKLCEELESSDEVKVLVITGSEKAFSTGLDVKEVHGKSPYEMSLIGDLSRKASWSLSELSIPTIAVIRGLAVGGGLELALCCDFRFAAEDSRFGQPEINLGIIPGGGATQRLPRLIGLNKAKELLFTGQMIDAKRALEIGLVDKLYPSEKVLEESLNFAKEIASKPLVALKALKRALLKGVEMPIESALVYEGQCFLQTFVSEDGREGLRAFVEKRKPEFKDR